MDFLALLKDVGFPVACAIALGYYARMQAMKLATVYEQRIAALEKAFTAQQNKVDSLNEYIRDDLAEIARESHDRERELIRMVRDHGGKREASKRHLEPTPMRQPTVDDGDTEVIAAERAESRKSKK